MPDLSDGTNWFEVDASNNKASPNGWPEGMMPSGVNDSARSDKGALKRFWDRANPVQTISPSGGVWLFTTVNPTYPAAYVNGEIFTFEAGAASAGGDQFAINILPAKPIYVLHATPTAIAANDIVAGLRPVLVYDSTLAAGAGGFVLVNPWNPVWGDGSGGAVTGGALTVTGDLSANNVWAINGNYYAHGGIVLSGQATGTGYTALYDNSGAPTIGLGTAANPLNTYDQTTHRFRSRGGTANYLVLDGTGAAFAGNASVAGTLTAVGATITGSGTALNVSGGSASVAGTLSAGAISTPSAAISALTIPGGGTALNVSAGNASVAGTLSAGALSASSATISALNVNGGGTALNVSGGSASIAGGLTVNSNLTVNGASQLLGQATFYASGVAAIYAPNGAIQTDGGGNAALYASNGGITVAGGGFKPGGGTWTATSDARTKKAVKAYKRGLEAVLQLRPVTYQHNGEAGTRDDGKTYVGLVADEVAPVMPEMVGVDADKFLTLDATALIYALCNAVKELAARLRNLETARA